MTKEQKAALGEVEIEQISATINHASEISEAIGRNDIIAIVAPINLQREFLAIAGDKPVIMAKNARDIVHNAEGGEDKVIFRFVKWERLLKIEVVMEDFVV